MESKEKEKEREEEEEESEEETRMNRWIISLPGRKEKHL